MNGISFIHSSENLTRNKTGIPCSVVHFPQQNSERSLGWSVGGEAQEYSPVSLGKVGGFTQAEEKATWTDKCV